jgi:hypothetical protein
MEIQGDKEMRQGIRMSQHIIIDERLEKKKNTHTHTQVIKVPTWSLTLGPVGLVEVRASWPGHLR